MMHPFPIFLTALLAGTASAAVAQGQDIAASAIPSTMSAKAQAQARVIYGMRVKTSVSANPGPDDERAKKMNALLGPINKQIADSVPVTRSEAKVSGIDTVRFDPKDPDFHDRVLIYLHGGAYVHFSARFSIGLPALVSNAARLPVLSVDYTLAPRGHPDSVTAEVVKVYRALLAKGYLPAHIGIFGDSAGGGLTAASVLRMKDEGLDLPGAIVLMSPWTDISGAGDTEKTLAHIDPFLTIADLDASARAYAGPDHLKSSYASPVYGDYSKGFSPTLIQAGTHELLLSDSVREYQAIRAGGAEAVLDIYEGMPHVFQGVFVGSPESQLALKRAAAFFKKHLGFGRTSDH